MLIVCGYFLWLPGFANLFVVGILIPLIIIAIWGIVKPNKKNLILQSILLVLIFILLAYILAHFSLDIG